MTQIIFQIDPCSVCRSRNLAAQPLPHVTKHWVNERLGTPPERTAADTAILAQSGALIAELQSTDTVVIGLPVYNFGVPASLKAWIDLVARPGVTFQYGPNGLLHNKRAIVAVVSGGAQIGSANDFASTYLGHVLGFMCLNDVQLVNAKNDAGSIPA